MSSLIQAMGAIAVLFFMLGFGPARPEAPESLKAPAGEEVILMAHATGKQIVHHFAGPAWRHIDGSEVTGKVVAKQDAPKADAIPWLLLSAASHKGDGVLARVTTIQRIRTEGGQPPKAGDCNVSANGKESRSAYSADY